MHMHTYPHGVCVFRQEILSETVYIWGREQICTPVNTLSIRLECFTVTFHVEQCIESIYAFHVKHTAT